MISMITQDTKDYKDAFMLSLCSFTTLHAAIIWSLQWNYPKTWETFENIRKKLIALMKKEKKAHNFFDFWKTKDIIFVTHQSCSHMPYFELSFSLTDCVTLFDQFLTVFTQYIILKDRELKV